ncbi:autotransporter assembly complex protein TamA [Gallibacterium anatis]|uniref:Translocation and assembly module subunit TamA n=1 Tax=Gallibacterium anatis TaxID=750 RepID=A0A263HK91_9PAST|nr:autotransporter assembly complex family protein [Gallibacterium anatis]KGQ26863.1 membrane protein [Gallibacterium anatis CCM5995]KGQ28783.1 membrane protein [Gallibacterium anatis]KGQ56865.1 membrane protein [Gallibacterium anatis DSM 16844 = F 149]WAX71333.1 autotransporter assembly complex protein TamA [Gallibacterium anatis]STO39182.1 outer membrane protein assembly factor YaeT [Gallibacterium anatis]
MMKWQKITFSLTILFAALSAFADKPITLKVEGIKNKAAYNNVMVHLSSLKTIPVENSDRYYYLASKTIDEALRAVGYFNSKIDYQFVPQPNAKQDLLIASVALDEPVKIAEIQVQLLGDAEKDENFLALQKQVPKLGTVLNQGVYDDYKAELEKVALAKGFFDYQFLTHRLAILPSAHEAYWQLAFDSGKRYRYGNIRFQGSQIREDYLRNILAIQSGDPYLINDLSELSTDLSASNWFKSVLVQPNIDKQSKKVDLDVLVQPRLKNSYEIGIGYGTDVGPRLQFGWNKPWINSRGQSFSSNFYISDPKKTIEATYKIPLLKQPLNYYYEISTGYEEEKKNDTDTSGLTLAILRYWNRETGWQNSFGVRARYDNFTQANVSNRTLLIYPTAGFNRTRVRGGLFPYWGDSQKITLNWGNKAVGSDVDFYSAIASTSWIRTYAENHRFLTRAEIGYLSTNQFDKIPPALRFFAGGDRSIRGYGYHKISPKDKNGELTGANRLFTASIEYQYQVKPKWWGAIFYDTGFASDRFAFNDLRKGAGIGVRWNSPIGAVKFDIATPINDKDDSKNIQFYIGIGAEL